jgi:Fe-S cluster assembly iron-binding protein IscA
VPLLHHGGSGALCGDDGQPCDEKDVHVIELTDRAKDMIGQLCASKDSPSAGLRIARRPRGLGLWMSLVDEPQDGDAVVWVEDVILYLDDAARQRLADRTLDARSNAQGAAFFI